MQNLITRAATVVIASLAAAGCAALMGAPVPSDDGDWIDNDIVGDWSATSKGDVRISTDGDGNIGISVEGDHHIISINDDDGSLEMDAYAAEIAGQRYLSVSMSLRARMEGGDGTEVTESGGSSVAGGSPMAGPFIPFHYTLNDDRMVAVPLDIGEIEDAVDDGDISGDIDSGCDIDLDVPEGVEFDDEDENDIRRSLRLMRRVMSMGFICSTVYADDGDLADWLAEAGDDALSDDEEIILRRD